VDECRSCGHIFIYFRGIICLTPSVGVLAFAPAALSLSHDQCDQLQKILDAKMRPARRHSLKHAGRCDARPRRRQASQLARLIMVVNAILSPREAPIGQWELLPEERMERMSHPEKLRFIDRMTCS
jgi:hypothetical protein